MEFKTKNEYSKLPSAGIWNVYCLADVHKYRKFHSKANFLHLTIIAKWQQHVFPPRKKILMKTRQKQQSPSNSKQRECSLNNFKILNSNYEEIGLLTRVKIARKINLSTFLLADFVRCSARNENVWVKPHTHCINQPILFEVSNFAIIFFHSFFSHFSLCYMCLCFFFGKFSIFFCI